MAEGRRPKTVVITGASSGIGAALARELGRKGDRLALVARRADRLDRVAKQVQEQGGQTLTIVEDLANPGAPGRIIDRVVDKFMSIDAIINNAGIGLPDYFGRSDPEAIRRQLEVNFNAPLLLTRLALPHLIESRGVVVNIGSAIVRLANPMLGAYGATKAGLDYWSDALRREMAVQGVRVCLVELGPVESEFFDAINQLAEDARVLANHAPSGTVYNAMRDRPPALLAATVEESARRIARLLDRPRARMAIRRRVVWPFRWFGAFFQIVPGLADLGIAAMIRRVDREEAAARNKAEGGPVRNPGSH